MDTVFRATLIEYKESSQFIGIFRNAEDAKDKLREHSVAGLYFREYTIKVSGRKFWVAELDEYEYRVDEEWVQ